MLLSSLGESGPPKEPETALLRWRGEADGLLEGILCMDVGGEGGITGQCSSGTNTASFSRLVAIENKDAIERSLINGASMAT